LPRPPLQTTQRYYFCISRRTMTDCCDAWPDKPAQSDTIGRVIQSQSQRGSLGPPHPLDSSLTIPDEIHEAVMALLPEERLDREKVNAAVRDGLKLGPLRPAGSADRRTEGDGRITFAGDGWQTVTAR
jgi:hypothetical protein